MDSGGELLGAGGATSRIEPGRFGVGSGLFRERAGAGAVDAMSDRGPCGPVVPADGLSLRSPSPCLAGYLPDD